MRGNNYSILFLRGKNYRWIRTLNQYSNYSTEKTKNAPRRYFVEYCIFLYLVHTWVLLLLFIILSLMDDTQGAFFLRVWRKKLLRKQQTYKYENKYNPQTKLREKKWKRKRCYPFSELKDPCAEFFRAALLYSYLRSFLYFRKWKQISFWGHRLHGFNTTEVASLGDTLRIVWQRAWLICSILHRFFSNTGPWIIIK